VNERDAEHRRLLDRIAIERVELALDLARARRAVRLPPLLHALAGALLSPRADAAGGWFGTALGLLRRYPVLTSLLGLVSPLLRRWRGLRRVAILAAVVAGILAARRGVRRAPPASPR
jgi:hypothetical protein